MLRILFMGTPDFATACLKKLTETKHNIVGVVTQPDKLQGRGMKLVYSDVKRYALEAGLDIYQPEKLKNGELLPVLESTKPDVIVVVAYGKILPKYVLEYARYGCINVHGSLLPEYRGAAPIQRAVIDGKEITGITTMYMDEGLDTGDILLTKEYKIDKNANTGKVFDDLAEIGADLLVETLEKLESGTAEPKKQDSSKATYAEKITAEECLINFDETSVNVHNRIRGLAPFPGAFTYLSGKVVKLYDSSVYEGDVPEDAQPGQIIDCGKKGTIAVKCKDGAVEIASFKPEGKKIMTASDMINGRKLLPGMIFETNF